MKALGTGWGARRSLGGHRSDAPPSGQPTLAAGRRRSTNADRLGVRRIHLSLTHSGKLAFAQVIFESSHRRY